MKKELSKEHHFKYYKKKAGEKEARRETLKMKEGPGLIMTEDFINNPY